MPNDKKKKVVERMDRTLIQDSPGHFVRMPQLHAKDKDLTITTKTYGSSGKMRKATNERQYFSEEGHGRNTSGKSISTSKYSSKGDVKKTVTLSFDRNRGPNINETDLKKTVTRGNKTVEKNVNFIDIKRLNKMNLK